MTSGALWEKNKKCPVRKAEFTGDGVLVLDKPSGPTSHDLVQQVKRVLGATKLGHGGTLDPFATGVLILLVNGATKLSPYLTDQEKRYRFTLFFGVETDTQDSTGRVVARLPCEVLAENEIRRACAEFTGDIEQTVPRYSAVRVRGKRLYRLARSGVEVTPPRRMVKISSLSLANVYWPEATFEVACSKGTYVRALGVDLARFLGCVGHVSRLRRLRSGGFDVGQAVGLDELRDIVARGELDQVLIPPAQAMEAYPEIRVSHLAAERLRQGGTLDASQLLGGNPNRFSSRECYRVLDPGGNLIAMVARSSGASPDTQDGEIVFKTLRVFGKFTEVQSQLPESGYALPVETG